MSNVTTFLAVADEGRFTQPENLTISGANFRGLNILNGLHTFITSKLMQSQTYYAVPIATVDQSKFLSLSAGNRDNFYYWSPSTHRLYELFNKGGTKTDKLDLGDEIVNGGNWADAQLLFDGSYNCTAAGNAGAAIINEKPDEGGVDVSCVSQLPMYLPKGTECPTSVSVGGVCPFGYLT
ncbi:MAG: hypothetical protein Q9168_003904 [Polycauliona sp. 1 TL-2023]